MPSKASKTRVLLRNNENGKLYKIASLYLKLDKYGGPYIKVMIPFGSKKKLGLIYIVTLAFLIFTKFVRILSRVFQKVLKLSSFATSFTLPYSPIDNLDEYSTAIFTL